MGTYYETYIAPTVKNLLKGSQTQKFTIVRHYNTIAITDLDAEKVKEEQLDLYVCYKHFDGSKMIETFEPFVGVLKDIYETFEGEKTPEEFMEQFPVYPLHRSIFINMIKQPLYKREEEIILDEIVYEKQQMLKSMETVFAKLSEKRPMLFLLDNMNMAPRSTMFLLMNLLEAKYENIFIYGAFNELYSQLPYMTEVWENYLDKLEDYSCIVDSEGEEIKVEEEHSHFHFESGSIEEYLVKLHNMYYLLDYEQAQYYLSIIYHKIEVEKLAVAEDSIFKFYILYAMISMYSDMPRALLLCDNLH